MVSKSYAKPIYYERRPLSCLSLGIHVNENKNKK